MVVRCGDIVSVIEKAVPKDLAEKWDNIGLLAGDPDRIIKSVLVCLDIDKDVISKALTQKADLVVSHHPPLFEKIDRILDNDIRCELLIPFVKNDICVYTAHTNLDSADNGVAYRMAKIMGLTDIIDVCGYGYFKLGNLPGSTNSDDFEKLVIKIFDTGHIRTIGDRNGMISRVMVYPGSFGEGMDEVLRHEPHVLVTGEVKYHHALVLLRRSVYTVEIGHCNSERIILPVIASLIRDAFDGLTVSIHKNNEPYRYRSPETCCG